MYVPEDSPFAALLSSALLVSGFVFLATLSRLSEIFPLLRWVTICLTMGIVGFTALIVLMVTLAGIFGSGILSSDGATDLPHIEPGHLPALIATFLCTTGAVFLSFIVYIGPFRRYIARWIPINPASFPEACGLSLVIGFLILAFIPLIITGVPPLFIEGLLKSLDPTGGMLIGTIQDDIWTLVWSIIGGFFIVGLFVSRTMKESCVRLGLVMPTLRQVTIALLLGVLLVSAFTVIDEIITMLFSSLHLPLTSVYEEDLKALFSYAMNPAGALMMALAAGFGEELIFRGVLQPRYGVLLSSLLFASLHSWQYSWDGCLSVLIAGLCFACIRIRMNTTVAAITHMIYDLILVFLIMTGMTSISG